MENNDDDLPSGEQGWVDFITPHVEPQWRKFQGAEEGALPEDRLQKGKTEKKLMKVLHKKDILTVSQAVVPLYRSSQFNSAVLKITRKKCIICQKESKHPLVSTPNGSKRLREASEVRNDDVSKRIKLIPPNSSFLYHVQNYEFFYLLLPYLLLPSREVVSSHLDKSNVFNT